MQNSDHFGAVVHDAQSRSRGRTPDSPPFVTSSVLYMAPCQSSLGSRSSLRAFPEDMTLPPSGPQIASPVCKGLPVVCGSSAALTPTWAHRIHGTCTPLPVELQAMYSFEGRYVDPELLNRTS